MMNPGQNAAMQAAQAAQRAAQQAQQAAQRAAQQAQESSRRAMQQAQQTAQQNAQRFQDQQRRNAFDYQVRQNAQRRRAGADTPVRAGSGVLGRLVMAFLLIAGLLVVYAFLSHLR